MRILFLSQRVPYPPNRGDKITTWRLVERMRRQHEVRVLAFAHGPEDHAAAAELGRRGIPTEVFDLHSARARLRALPLLLGSRPLTLGIFGSPALQAATDRLAPHSDLAYAYSSSMGAFLLPHPELPFLMHMAELDSDKWRQYAERGRAPMSWVHAREARTLLAFEKRLAQAARATVFCTPLEQAIFGERIPGQRSLVLRNGVDLAHFRPAPERAEPAHLMFTGVMDYHPNADACVWFAKEILPALRRRFPAVRLSIVGSAPNARVRALARLPGVQVTGKVPDTRDYLERASIAIAPLRIARGIQNKVLEAMAMGLPLVGTTPATQGVGARAGEHYLVEDLADGQVRALSALLSDVATGRALGARARRYVEENYAWEHCLAPLDALLAEHGSSKS